ncbi:hypothetical protein AAFF_G00357100 [Aldrovandia affinis]|uniref:Uncharacterized protein n=1 Tax=Aldrovandia affinis TaxID=143900 RepID=A0AAD7T9H1_9TELE|nr:hypothetical protein AAFF_G00357100 [Aldrovandia affinis]
MLPRHLTLRPSLGWGGIPPALGVSPRNLSTGTTVDPLSPFLLHLLVHSSHLSLLPLVHPRCLAQASLTQAISQTALTPRAPPPAEVWANAAHQPKSPIECLNVEANQGLWPWSTAQSSIAH